ncbi:hypothetical protein YB2330_005041 [Saitoella coloradoensis]
MSEQPLRVGIIGTGIFASKRHLPAYQKLPSEYKVVACANRTVSKAELFAEKANIPSTHVFSCLDELIKFPDVDIVDALLPVTSNLATVLKAVEAGKPIMIEKPLAHDLADARELVKVCASTDIPVLVAENWSYREAIPKMMKAVVDKCGEVVGFEYVQSIPFRPDNPYLGTAWRATPSHVGGFLSDGGVHQIAFLTGVLGQVERVSAFTRQIKKVNGTVDTVKATMQLKSGVIGTYGLDFASAQPGTGYFRIHGTEGTVEYRFTDFTLSYTSTTSPGEPEVVVAGKDEDDVKNEFENFAEAVRASDKTLLKCTVEDAFHHFAVVCAMVESGEKDGEGVAIPQP